MSTVPGSTFAPAAAPLAPLGAAVAAAGAVATGEGAVDPAFAAAGAAVAAGPLVAGALAVCGTSPLMRWETYQAPAATTSSPPRINTGTASEDLRADGGKLAP